MVPLEGGFCLVMQPSAKQTNEEPRKTIHLITLQRLFEFVFESEEETKEIICVNPLTWRLDGLAAPASSNLGSRPIRAIQGWRTGRFMGELRPGLFSAQCADGVLWTEAPAESGFSQSVFPGRNHHGAESSFFFLAHRANAELRLRAFQGEGV